MLRWIRSAFLTIFFEGLIFLGAFTPPWLLACVLSRVSGYSLPACMFVYLNLFFGFSHLCALVTESHTRQDTYLIMAEKFKGGLYPCGFLWTWSYFVGGVC